MPAGANKSTNKMTYQIELLEPRAKKLLDDLAEMDLIRIQASPAPSEAFRQLLAKLREQNVGNDILEDITQEVEQVRAKRYAPKHSAQSNP